jgi:hypothetical protein
MQFGLAKKHIKNYNAILENQTIIKDNQGLMKQEITTLSERQKRVYEDFIPQLTDGLDKIHSKLDTHITEETQEFQEIRDSLKTTAAEIKGIQYTLDSVSANGKQGLSASLTDVLNKIGTLERLTHGARMRAKLWVVLHDVVLTTPILKPLKNKWGAIIYAIIIMFIANTILHSLGVDFDVFALVKWLIEQGKSGG